MTVFTYHLAVFTFFFFFFFLIIVQLQTFIIVRGILCCITEALKRREAGFQGEG